MYFREMDKMDFMDYMDYRDLEKGVRCQVPGVGGSVEKHLRFKD